MLKQSLANINERQIELEEEIFGLTAENQARKVFKEKLIEILPEMHYSMQQGKNKPTKNLENVVRSLENNQNKAELLTLL